MFPNCTCPPRCIPRTASEFRAAAACPWTSEMDRDELTKCADRLERREVEVSDVAA
jgi:hypothetical protein